MDMNTHLGVAHADEEEHHADEGALRTPNTFYLLTLPHVLVMEEEKNEVAAKTLALASGLSLPRRGHGGSSDRHPLCLTGCMEELRLEDDDHLPSSYMRGPSRRW